MLLDCAAFAPTNRLDLAVWKPDFVALSFYKMFGYPTGVGCLLARREALARLPPTVVRRRDRRGRRVGAEFVVPLSGHAGFEDGTVDYLGIPAVEIGLRRLRRIGVDIVAQRVEALGSWLLAALRGLRHADGSPATRIYGPATWDRRGGTVAFNFLDRDGRVVDERLVDRAAAAHRISIRTGCFCNPGAGEAAFALSPAALRRAAPGATTILDDHLARVGMPTGGAVRVSLGLASTFADVHRFIAFASGFRDREADPAGLPPRLSC